MVAGAPPPATATSSATATAASITRTGTTRQLLIRSTDPFEGQTGIDELRNEV